mmetsp:Transcript_129994/g.259316  ORF Transcript_129994/g.259316 Transcript_129994/m.259316 type:complete len:80 (+) Transcript_129994:308-547(+)
MIVAPTASQQQQQQQQYLPTRRVVALRQHDMLFSDEAACANGPRSSSVPVFVSLLHVTVVVTITDLQRNGTVDNLLTKL